MADDLKPCPFCGGEAKLIIDCDVEQAYCIRCGATVEYPVDYYDEGNLDGTHVIPMWNRRVSPIDCNKAEYDSNGCLGYGVSYGDDEPCDKCKSCENYNWYGFE